MPQILQLLASWHLFPDARVRADGELAARRTRNASVGGVSLTVHQGVGRMGQPLVGTHVPVLRDRCLELLAPAFSAAAQAGRAPVLLDATVGLGGHAEDALVGHSRLQLIGLDRDPDALILARQRLQRFAARASLVHATYDQLAEVLSRRDVAHVDGVLFDLGVSSLQLDSAQRGFSYAQDAPLDMRMDPALKRTAAEVLRTYSTAELTKVLRRYGEERFAARIAAAVVRRRAHAPLSTTGELAQLVRESIPAPARRTGGNPAKRTFQALRIEVNDELAALPPALSAALDQLAPGGRIVVLSYHSLEDRITKRVLAQRARSSAPPDLPVEPPGTAPTMRLLTRGAERPGEAEVAVNPRAASARLRAAERIADNGSGGDGRRGGAGHSVPRGWGAAGGARTGQIGGT